MSAAFGTWPIYLAVHCADLYVKVTHFQTDFQTLLQAHFTFTLVEELTSANDVVMCAKLPPIACSNALTAVS